MTSHDNVTDIVERLGWHHEHPVTGALVLRNHDGPEAADTIATLRKQLEDAREALTRICDAKQMDYLFDDLRTIAHVALKGKS